MREEIPYHPALASSPSKYTVTYRPGPALVNLMVCGALFKLPHRAEKVAYIPRRAHPTRRRAIFLLSHQIMLDDHSRNLLISLFSAYLEDTAEKVIVLRHVETGELLPMPYRHRFTPQGMRDLLRKFDAVWERAMKQADREGWKVAVFLTLTTDPSKHGSLMEGYRRSGEALNRFMSWLAKRLGGRPPYIAVCEFTRTGLVHFHILFFGVSRLADYRKISQMWERTGQGRIVFLYQVVRRGNTWVRPGRGSGPSNIHAYMRKCLRAYLSKALLAGGEEFLEGLDWESPTLADVLDPADLTHLALYWASGKRFFTYSRRFSVPVDERESTGLWEFFCVAYLEELAYLSPLPPGGKPPPILLAPDSLALAELARVEGWPD